MQHTVNTVLKRLHLKKEQKESEARQGLKKELFAFNYCVDHGFPSKPTAIAYEPYLQLLAIGTKAGDLRIYGAPGVEFVGNHSSYVAVKHIFFIPKQGRLITLCSDDSLHLWQIDAVENGITSSFGIVRSLSLEISKLKKIRACCLTSDGSTLCLGTDTGNIHYVDVNTFKLSSTICQPEFIIQNAPEEFKVTPGPIDCLVQHPTDPNQILIGIGIGLIILWDRVQRKALVTFPTTQLEWVTFHRDGKEFMSCHTDGSYNIWSAVDASRARDHATTPYGPFPCKQINKIMWKTCSKAEPLIILSGGMPRASHGEKSTVSVIQAQDAHAVFEFTSKVIDFVALCASQPGDTKHSHDNPHTLLVLTEEELVAIDLSSVGWPIHALPYLNSIHFSPILSASHVASVPSQFYESLEKLGLNQRSAGYSKKNWPIQGGRNLTKSSTTLDLLLTGHENGSVCFWDVSTVSMRLVYKLSTAAIFGINAPAEVNQTQEGEDDWPPFRKVGAYDPFSDDPQVGIQKIVLCCHSQLLVLAGTAGQVIVLDLVKTDRQQQIQVGSLNLLSDVTNGYVWKGHDSLTVNGSDILFPAGFQPRTVVQVNPPAMCSALTVHAPWQIFAVGTAHGYGLFDYAQNKAVYTRCTLAAPGEENVSGSLSPKTWRRSLRESFRRLRARRIPQQIQRRLSNASQRMSNLPVVRRMSQRSHSQSMDAHMNDNRSPDAPDSSTPVKTSEVTTPKEVEALGKGKASPPSSPQHAPQPSGDGPSTSEASPPQTPGKGEAAGGEGVELRSTDELMTSQVRSLYLAETFLMSAHEPTASLWVGTSSGRIYAHRITVPIKDKRLSEAVTCVQGKEIHLKHRAPVISLSVVDRTMQPVSGIQDGELERTKATDMTGAHQLIVSSEQQIKIFSLPSLNMVNKFKLSSQDPNRIRKSCIINFTSKSDANYVERDLIYLTQSGDINLLSLPHLRPQIKGEQIKLDNSSLNACLFTLNGEGFFLNYPSEYLRVSFSTCRVRKPHCALPISEGARPVLNLDGPTSSLQRQQKSSRGQPADVTTKAEISHPVEPDTAAAATNGMPAAAVGLAAAEEYKAGTASHQNGDDYEYEGSSDQIGDRAEHGAQETTINGAYDSPPSREINHVGDDASGAAAACTNNKIEDDAEEDDEEEEEEEDDDEDDEEEDEDDDVIVTEQSNEAAQLSAGAASSPVSQPKETS